VISYVPDAAIKDILIQPISDGKRGKYITKMLEYELEIKPTKLIKGQGLTRIMTETNLDTFDVNSIMELLDFPEDESMVKVDDCFRNCAWYTNVIYILQNLQVPLGTNKARAQFLRLKYVKYCLLDGYLFWKDLQGILLNYPLEYETKEIIK